MNYILRDFYEKFKNAGFPFSGFYLMSKPVAVITDLELVKNIMVKDFNNFNDRYMFFNEKQDPLTAHLFNLDGEKWKPLRKKMTPTFTSGKMKFMFPTIQGVSKELESAFEKSLNENSSVEIVDLLARFTTDVIGTCAFGVECNSLRDPNAEFRNYGRIIFTKGRHTFPPMRMFIMTFPRLARKLGIRVIPDDTHNFFMNVVKETVEYREKNNIQRNDFMNILMEMRKENESGMTIEEIASQTFLFFIAGFDTSSTTMSFALFELAHNQEIQEKLRAEILETLENDGGELQYESTNNMPYLDQVICETLRKYSVLSALTRMTQEDYKVPNTKYVIEKGVMVMIPIDAIHYDEDIYPEPNKFDPDRFTEENMKTRHPMTWLPFGDGPRNCIGLRFGKMQAKIGLISLLSKFKFSVCPETENPVTLNPRTFILSPLEGINLKVERI
uniref:Cytochrome P450 n=1 Tax=Megaselia scalaris TaxID=36166 RepID=T1GD08_MEGSC